jgi:hypothetical protein
MRKDSRKIEFDDQGGYSGRKALRYPGQNVLNPKARDFQIFKLEWPNDLNVIRLWNYPHPEDWKNRILSGRTSIEGSAGLQGVSLSSSCLYVRNAGGTQTDSDKIFLASYIEAKNTYDEVFGIPYSELPFVTLSSYSDAAAKGEIKIKGNLSPSDFSAMQSWDGGKSSKLRIPKIESGCFAVAFIYQLGSVFNVMFDATNKKSPKSRDGVPLGMADDDPIPVLFLKSTAVKSLLALCNWELPEPDPGFDPDKSPHKMFKIGDICGRYNHKENRVVGGKMLAFYGYSLQIDNHWRSLSSNQMILEGLLQPPKNACYFAAAADTYKFKNLSFSGSLDSEQIAIVKKHGLYFWRDEDEGARDDDYLLHFPPIEERCELLARAYGSLPGFLDTVWQFNPDYLAFDAVRAILRKRAVFESPKVLNVKNQRFSDDEDDMEVDVFPNVTPAPSSSGVFSDEDDEDDYDDTSDDLLTADSADSGDDGDEDPTAIGDDDYDDGEDADEDYDDEDEDYDDEDYGDEDYDDDDDDGGYEASSSTGVNSKVADESIAKILEDFDSAELLSPKKGPKPTKKTRRSR